MEYRRKAKSFCIAHLYQPLFVTYFAIGIFYISRLLGIISFVYERRLDVDSKRQTTTVPHIRRKRQVRGLRLRTVRALRWYGIAVLFLVIASTPFALYTLYTQMYFLTLTPLLSIVGNMRFVLIQGFAIIVMLWNCCNQKRLVRFLNRWLSLQYALDALPHHSLNIRATFAARLQCMDRKSCVLLCTKLLMLLLAPVLTVYVIYRENALKRPKLLASLLFNCSCSILLQVTNVIYYACALKVAHYGKQINELLQCALVAVRQHLNGLHSLSVQRQKRLICLCKVIIRLRWLYERNLQLSRELVQLFTPSLFVFFFYALVLCTVQLFVLYFLTCSRNAGAFKPSGISSTDKCSSPNFIGLISVSSMFADICIIVWGSHLMQARLGATRSILAEGAILLPPSRATCKRGCCKLQLEAALAEFSLYLRMEYQQQHRCRQRYIYFMVCGLFALDRRLIYAMFERILNYLIILIQYDKVS